MIDLDPEETPQEDVFKDTTLFERFNRTVNGSTFMRTTWEVTKGALAAGALAALSHTFTCIQNLNDNEE